MEGRIMKITNDFLKEVMPQSTEANRQKYLEWLNYFMPIYNIDSDDEIAAFVAQIGHESQSFNRVKENLNYSSKRLLDVFPKYFPNKATADLYANKPKEIGNRVYANRMGNGNEKSGDGYKYSGKGLIMNTGKAEYATLSKEMGEDLITYPELLETPKYAVWSACIFWNKNKLNDLV